MKTLANAICEGKFNHIQIRQVFLLPVNFYYF